MKRKKLGLVHTSATLVPIFEALCREKLSNVDVFNIVDDSLIKDVIARGELTDSVSRRVAGHIASAESAGADLIMVTCSSIGAAVEAAAPSIKVPVVRVDQAMVDKAVSMGKNIGVVATLTTTMWPTVDLIRRTVIKAGTETMVGTKLCDGAFAALMSGDAAKHDAMVSAAIKELSTEVDVIVLAQASMARVASAMREEDRRVPILTSPPLGVERVAMMMESIVPKA